MTTREEIEERRRGIAGAALRVLAREGLQELSVRKVAAEAGLAPSSLRYAVPTQAGLRELAISLVIDRLQARIDAVVAVDVAQWARAVMLELLPLDGNRRFEMEVSLALGTAALSEEELMPIYLKTHEAVHAVCAKAARVLVGEDYSQAQVDRLHGLIDGLALHIVRQPPEAGTERAVAALDLHLHEFAAR